MALLKYLKREKDPLPDKENCPLLTEKELKSANEKVKDCLKRKLSKARTLMTRGKYITTTHQNKELRLENMQQKMGPPEPPSTSLRL